MYIYHEVDDELEVDCRRLQRSERGDRLLAQQGVARS